MKKFLLAVFFFVSVNTIYGQGPVWEWARGAKGNGGEGGACIATDHEGNIYVVGTFLGDSISFGSITLYSAAQSHYFIVKYDAIGHMLWAKSAKDYGGGLAPSAVTVDIYGNCFVTGSFRGDSVSFDGFTLYNKGMVTVKYDATGNVTWVDSPANVYRTNGFEGDAIATDKSNNIYVAGIFDSDTIFFGGDTLPVDNSSCGGCFDAYIAKYDNGGNQLWARIITGYDNEFATGVSCDDSGNVYVTGNFRSDTITIDGIILSNPDAIGETFIAKYDASGNVLWAHSAIGMPDYPTGIAADAGGDVYITGFFYNDSVIFGNITLQQLSPNGSTIFVVKYNSSGNVLWAKSSGGTSLNSNAFSICLNDSNDFYITGTFNNDSVYFDNLLLVNTDILNATSDMFVAKYNSSGNIKWVKNLGGSDQDYSYSIAANSSGEFITGTFASPLLICGGDTLHNLVAVSSGDYFIAKLGNTIAGVAENKNHKTGVDIYPNPTHNKLTVVINSTSRTLLTLTDLTGRLILERGLTPNPLSKGEGALGATIEMDVSGVAKGVYVVTVGDGEREVRGKVVVE